MLIISWVQAMRFRSQARWGAAASRQLCAAAAGRQGRPIRHRVRDSLGPSAIAELMCHWKPKLKHALLDGFLPTRRCRQSEHEGNKAVIRILCLCQMKSQNLINSNKSEGIIKKKNNNQQSCFFWSGSFLDKIQTMKPKVMAQCKWLLKI